MNSQLTQRLVERFPVLYQDYHSPMTQTCMCCGFDHGDGWFEIVAAQSGHRRRVGLLVAAEARVPGEERIFPQLSPVRDDKRKQEGSGTKEDPYRWVVVEKAPRDCLARMAWKLFPPPRFEIIAVGPRSSSVSGSRHLFGGRTRASRRCKSRKNSERCGSIAAVWRRSTNTYGSRNGSLR